MSPCKGFKLVKSVLLLNFFTSTTKGLLGSKIKRSAFDPFDKVPCSKFKISAGFFVSFLITFNKFFVAWFDLPAYVVNKLMDKVFSGNFFAYIGAIIPPNEWPTKCPFSNFESSLILSRSIIKSFKLKFLWVTGDFPWPLKSYVITVKCFDNLGTINLQASSAAPIPWIKNNAGPFPMIE